MILITEENGHIKFKNTHKVANEFVNIIAPTFGLSTGIKIAIKARLKLVKDQELRDCLSDVLKFLLVEYKK